MLSKIAPTVAGLVTNKAIAEATKPTGETSGRSASSLYNKASWIPEAKTEYETGGPGKWDQFTTGAGNFFGGIFDNAKVSAALKHQGIMSYDHEESFIDNLARDLYIYENTPLPPNATLEEKKNKENERMNILQRAEAVKVHVTDDGKASIPSMFLPWGGSITKWTGGTTERSMTPEDLKRYIELRGLDPWTDKMKEYLDNQNTETLGPDSRGAEIIGAQLQETYDRINDDAIMTINGVQYFNKDRLAVENVLYNASINSAREQLASYIANAERWLQQEEYPAGIELNLQRAYKAADDLAEYTAFIYNNYDAVEGDMAKLNELYENTYGVRPMKVEGAIGIDDMTQYFKIQRSMDDIAYRAMMAQREVDGNRSHPGMYIRHQLNRGISTYGLLFTTLASIAEKGVELSSYVPGVDSTRLSGNWRLNNIDNLGMNATMDSVAASAADIVPSLAADLVGFKGISKVFKVPEALDDVSRMMMRLPTNPQGVAEVTNMYRTVNMARVLANSAGLNLVSGKMVSDVAGMEYTDTDLILDLTLGLGLDALIDGYRVLSRSAINKGTKEFENIFWQNQAKTRGAIPDAQWDQLLPGQKQQLGQDMRELISNAWKKGDELTDGSVTQLFEANKSIRNGMMQRIDDHVAALNELLISKAKNMDKWKDKINTVVSVDDFGRRSITYEFDKSITADDIANLHEKVLKDLQGPSTWIGKHADTISKKLQLTNDRARQRLTEKGKKGFAAEVSEFVNQLVSPKVWKDLKMQNAWRLMNPADLQVFDYWLRTKYPDPNDPLKTIRDISTPSKLKKAITEFGADSVLMKEQYSAAFPHRSGATRKKGDKTLIRDEKLTNSQDLGVIDVTDLSYEEAVAQLPGLKRNGSGYFNRVMNARGLTWEEKNYIVNAAAINKTDGRILDRVTVSSNNQNWFANHLEKDYFLGRSGKLTYNNNEYTYWTAGGIYKHSRAPGKAPEDMYQFLVRDLDKKFAFTFYVDFDGNFHKGTSFPVGSEMILRPNIKGRPPARQSISSETIVKMDVPQTARDFLADEFKFSDGIRSRRAYPYMAQHFPDLESVPKAVYDNIVKNNRIPVQDKVDLIRKAANNKNLYESGDFFLTELSRVRDTPVFTSAEEAAAVIPRQGWVATVEEGAGQNYKLVSKSDGGDVYQATTAGSPRARKYYFAKKGDEWELYRDATATKPLGVIRLDETGQRMSMYINGQKFHGGVAFFKYDDKVAQTFANLKQMIKTPEIKSMSSDQAIELVTGQKVTDQDRFEYRNQSPEQILVSQLMEYRRNPFYPYLGVESKDMVEIIKKVQPQEETLKYLNEFYTKYRDIEGVNTDYIWEANKMYEQALKETKISSTLADAWTQYGPQFVGNKELAMRMIYRAQFGVTLTEGLSDILLTRFFRRRDNILTANGLLPASMDEIAKREAYRKIQEQAKFGEKVVLSQSSFMEAITKMDFAANEKAVIEFKDIRQKDNQPLLDRYFALADQYDELSRQRATTWGAVRTRPNKIAQRDIMEELQLIELELMNSARAWENALNDTLTYNQYVAGFEEFGEGNMIQPYMKTPKQLLDEHRGLPADMTPSVIQNEAPIPREEVVSEATIPGGVSEPLTGPAQKANRVKDISESVFKEVEVETVTADFNTMGEMIGSDEFRKTVESLNNASDNIPKLVDTNDPMQMISKQYTPPRVRIGDKQVAMDTDALETQLAVMEYDFRTYGSEGYVAIASTPAFRAYMLRALQNNREIPSSMYSAYLISIGFDPRNTTRITRGRLWEMEMIRMQNDYGRVRFIPHGSQPKTPWFEGWSASIAYDNVAELSASRFYVKRGSVSNGKYSPNIKSNHISHGLDNKPTHLMGKNGPLNIKQVNWEIFKGGNPEMFTAREIELLIPEGGLVGKVSRIPLVTKSLTSVKVSDTTLPGTQRLLQSKAGEPISKNLDVIRKDFQDGKSRLYNTRYNLENQILKRYPEGFDVYSIGRSFDQATLDNMSLQNNVAIRGGTPETKQMFEAALSETHAKLDIKEFSYRKGKGAFETSNVLTEIDNTSYWVKKDPTITNGDEIAMKSADLVDSPARACDLMKPKSAPSGPKEWDLEVEGGFSWQD